MSDNSHIDTITKLQNETRELKIEIEELKRENRELKDENILMYLCARCHAERHKNENVYNLMIKSI